MYTTNQKQSNEKYYADCGAIYVEQKVSGGINPYPSIKKTGIKLLCMTLFATLTMATTVFADDDEDDGLPKKAYSLGQERPKAKSKPKVIIKERIVEKIVCPSGSTWNADVKKCQDEDGNDLVVIPKSKKKQQVAHDDSEPAIKSEKSERYVYPGTKLRIKMDKCMMQGETVTCELSLTNTSEGETKIELQNTTVTDESGASYKLKNWDFISGGRHQCCWYYLIGYGQSATIKTVFPLVNPATNSVNFSMLIKTNKGTDFVKFNNNIILK